MPQTIYGSFTDPTHAEKAAGALLDFGVRQEDLSVVANEAYQFGSSSTSDTPESGWRGGETRGAVLERPGAGNSLTSSESEIGTPSETESILVRSDARDRIERDNVARPDNTEDAAKHGISTTTGADAGIGAVKGAGIGLGIGVVAGVAAIAFVPGIGTLLGAGLLTQAITTAIAGAVGTTAAGAIAGGVTGYLKDQGVEGHVAERYNQTVTAGGAIVAVTLPSNGVDVATAQSILEKYGATNITNY